MDWFDDAFETAIGAGDDRVSCGKIGRQTTVTDGHAVRYAEFLRRFCEYVPAGTTVEEVLDALDDRR